MKKSECLLSVFFKISLAGGAQLVVPLLAEAARQRTLKKLIQPHVVFSAHHYRAFADFPTVVVDCGEVGKFLEAGRVEMA